MGILRLYDNENKPYMLKKKYKNLSEGVCYIRKGSQQSNAKRIDFDRFYVKKETPYFRIPSSSERVLSCDNGKIISTIKDGSLIKNISNSIALDVTIHCFLNVLITNQHYILAGDISPTGEVSLSKLDDAIHMCVNDIAEIKTKSYAKYISHICMLRIEYMDVNGVSWFQVLDAGLSWIFTTEKIQISFGRGDYTSKAEKSNDIFDFQPQFKKLISSWERFIKKRNYVALEKIDESGWVTLN